VGDVRDRRRLPVSCRKRANLKEARGLYLVLTDPGAPWKEIVRAAVVRRVPVVQLREKGLPDSALVLLARAIAAETRGSETIFIVNDRPDIALAAGADGVHLGRGDMDPRTARAILGADAVIGSSASGARDARAIAREPIDYVGVGPVFPTGTKPDAAAPIGLSGFREVARLLPDLPKVAIGGITAGNVREVLAAGADLVAVVSAVCRAADPVEALDGLLAAIGSGPAPGSTLPGPEPSYDIDAQVNREGLRYCPRCATKLEESVVRYHRRLACPACGYVFYLTPAPVTCVVVEKDGAVLLVRRRYPPKAGDWCLPAGFVEVDESPAESAVREVEEETGLAVAITGLVDCWASDEDPRTPVVSFAFTARVSGGSLKPGDDATEAAFIGQSSLPGNISLTTHRSLIAKRFAKREER
jgi:thiamine-phosphate pyrophosphorylase